MNGLAVCLATRQRPTSVAVVMAPCGAWDLTDGLGPGLEGGFALWPSEPLPRLSRLKQ
jgi:hypothetical protein